MATALHVFRRKGIFYWRRRLPPVMAVILKTSHLCRSLRTTDRRKANHFAMLISIAVDQLADDLSIMADLKQPTKNDLNKILFEIFNSILDKGEFRRAAAGIGSDPWRKPTTSKDEELNQKYSALGLNDPDDVYNAAKDALTMNERDIASSYTRPLFRRDNLAYFVDENGIGYKEHNIRRAIFERMVLAVIATAEKFNAERDNGIYNPAIFPFASNRKEATPHSPLEAWERQRISVIHKDYVQHKTPDWKDDSRGKAEHACRLFVGLVGDLPYLTITRKDASSFRNRLDELPRSYGQHPVFRGLNGAQAIERADEIRAALDEGKLPIRYGQIKLDRAEAEKATRRLHPGTTNSHIHWMNAFYDWLIKEGRFDQTNPFAAIGHSKIRVEKATPEEEIRKPWPPELLEKLFHHPIWTGFDNRQNRNRPGKRIIEDENFWAPLIAVFTGMREEEILQLWTKDICTIDDIPCFDINASDSEGKALKTRHAARIIPVHSELIKIGFLKYVAEAKKQKSHLLFPGAQRSRPKENGEKGRLVPYYTKAFNRIRVNLGVPPSYNFHTLRNTFDTALEAYNLISSNLGRYLMGHAMHGEGGTYIDGRQPKPLRKVVELVKPTIDFSHLYEGEQRRERDFTEHPSRKGDKERK